VLVWVAWCLGRGAKRREDEGGDGDGDSEGVGLLKRRRQGGVASGADAPTGAGVLLV
jgi:hypothetical protein